MYGQHTMTTSRKKNSHIEGNKFLLHFYQCSDSNSQSQLFSYHDSKNPLNLKKEMHLTSLGNTRKSITLIMRDMTLLTFLDFIEVFKQCLPIQLYVYILWLLIKVYFSQRHEDASPRISTLPKLT